MISRLDPPEKEESFLNSAAKWILSGPTLGLSLFFEDQNVVTVEDYGVCVPPEDERGLWNEYKQWMFDTFGIAKDSPLIFILPVVVLLVLIFILNMLMSPKPKGGF